MTDPREALRALVEAVRVYDAEARGGYPPVFAVQRAVLEAGLLVGRAAALLLVEAPRQTDEPGTVLDCGR